MAYSHSWDRFPTEQDPLLFRAFAGDLELMLRALRYSDELIDFEASTFAGPELMIVPRPHITSAPFQWLELLDFESAQATTWAEMNKAGLLDPGWAWFQCKTERSAFDIVVCAALIRAKHIYRNAIRVSSDGTWEHEWAFEQPAVGSAIDLCLTVFGLANNPLQPVS